MMSVFEYVCISKGKIMMISFRDETKGIIVRYIDRGFPEFIILKMKWLYIMRRCYILKYKFFFSDSKTFIYDINYLGYEIKH